MSILGKLDRKTLKNLPDILAEIDIKLDGWEKNANVNGKNIESANVEHTSWVAYYDETKVEARILFEFMKMKIDEKRGLLTSFLIENLSMDVNEKSRERMIDADAEYIKLYQSFLLVKEVKDRAEMVSDVFKQRGYALKNITSIRVADVQDVTLYVNDRH